LIAPILFFYNLAWLAARPFLRRHPRLQQGWAERTLAEGRNGPFDLWIQAASGGEAQLVNMILDELAAMANPNQSLAVLATSGTQQGVDSLNKALPRQAKEKIATTVAYFPFDQPSLMAKAFTRFAPKLAVIVETELWPGFLATAHRHRVPVLLVNGRMSEKSHRSYRHFSHFFNHYGPKAIQAISATDGARFAKVFGEARVQTVNNLKFDRITPPKASDPDSPLQRLFPANTPMILLGSVRQEEEELLLPVVAELLTRRPDAIVALFPKHLERAEPWCRRLLEKGVTAVRRSQASDRQTPGSVIVWDLFGELAGAYALATTTFVGGSLLPLGGQNFLEPLVFGLLALRLRRSAVPFALIVAAAFCVRLYPAVSSVNLTPDAVEYLDQARHNARGSVGTVSIKRHYLDDYPVVHSGLGYRPPLFPLAAGAVLALTGSVRAVQTVNALIASLAVGVWYLAFARLFSRATAAGAAVAGAFGIWFWGTSAISLTEPVSMLVAGGILWTVAVGGWRSFAGAAALGGLCALAYLARHMNVLFLPLVAGLWAADAARGRPAARRGGAAARLLLAACVGAALIAPVAAKNIRDFGRPFYDPNAAVLRGGKETFNRFSARPPETFAGFLREADKARLIRDVARGYGENLKQILAGPGGLGLMGLALPLAALALVRERPAEGVWFLAGLAALNYAAYAPLYSFHYGDPRFILLSTFSLAPLCLHGVERWAWLREKSLALTGKPGRLPRALVAVLVAASVLQGVWAFSAMLRRTPVQILDGTPVRVLPHALLRYAPGDYDRLFEEVRRLSGAGEVVATGLPWMVNFFTLRPTALLPVDLREETLPTFTETYRVGIVVLDPASMGEERFLRHVAWVRNLARSGRGTMTESGPFILYRPG